MPRQHETYAFHSQENLDYLVDIAVTCYAVSTARVTPDYSGKNATAVSYLILVSNVAWRHHAALNMYNSD